jgi:hypothetical protein
MGSIPDCLGAAKNQLGDEIVTVPGGLGMLSYQIFYSKNERFSKGSNNFILCQTLCILSFLQYLLHLRSSTEAEFLDVISTKILRVFLLAIHSHL